jgi:hypothetical protein
VVVCKNGTLEFGFSRIDGKQLEYVIRTYDPAVVRQFSRDCVEHTIAHSQELLNHKRNHEATEYLLKYWEATHIRESSQDSREMCKKWKNLFVRSLSWNPEVQKYAIAAPLYHITDDVLKVRDSGGRLPTITEYRQHKWMEKMYLANPWPGVPFYSVWLDGYHGGFHIGQKSPLFKTIQDQVGNAGVNDAAKIIRPISGELLDATVEDN